MKRQRNVDNSSSDESDVDLRSKRPRGLKTVAIKEETTDQSSDEEEIKFDPNQPSTSYAHCKLYNYTNLYLLINLK